MIDELHPVSPVDDPRLQSLLDLLAESSSSLKTENDWPGQQLIACATYGVFRWFSAAKWGGTEKSLPEIYQGYIKLASSCLTTTFVITQRQGACRRIENSGNSWLAKQLVPKLNSGEIFATVGLSHLTTSRRHLDKPAMHAKQTTDGFVLNGFSPWVTGANSADWMVVGATMDDGRQLLIAVETNLPGVTIKPGPRLVALSSSQTGSVNCRDVEISNEYLVAGPIENVMQTGVGGNTGGIQTSALALGLSRAAIDFVASESGLRPELASIASALEDQWRSSEENLMDLAGGGSSVSKNDLRTEANSLALRCTQAALSAAKGAGYVEGHAVGRWCKEALFFLVWSCPQAVAQANLCEFAGID